MGSVRVRFLIADDNANARKLLRALLETRQGWEVCGEAENGKQASGMATELKPDFVILDLAMPMMDGLHAAQAISTAHPATPILLYTMHNFSGLDLEAKKVGIRIVISKTAPADMLLQAIEDISKSAAPSVPLALPEITTHAVANTNGAAETSMPSESDPSAAKPN